MEFLLHRGRGLFANHGSKNYQKGVPASPFVRIDRERQARTLSRVKLPEQIRCRLEHGPVGAPLGSRRYSSGMTLPSLVTPTKGS
jgi:hypothetical protein